MITTGLGLLTRADALAYREKLRNGPEFDPSFSQLLDFSDITKLELEAEDVRWFAQTSSTSPDARRAILASGDLEFGFGRTFETLRENAGEKGINVFRKLDDALDWILAKNN